MFEVKKLTNKWFGYIIAGIFVAWLYSHWNLDVLEKWPEDVTDRIIDSKGAPEFDFVIVGSGTGGSVVAGRLSEITGWNILIIEAGGDPIPNSKIPAFTFLTHRTISDWNYTSEEEEGSCRGYQNKKCLWTRGRTIGGSSSVNAMIYLRGSEADFDEWEALGNPGWGYKSVVKYFEKLERRQYLGRFGAQSPWKDSIFGAWKELGYDTHINLYQPKYIGIADSLGTVKGGERFTPADSYLKDRGDNIKFMKNSQVTKIQLDSKNNVKGVFVKVQDKTVYIKVKKELILSSGALNTPQILMMSGIGPKKHLESFGIKVKQDLAVGENLQDHAIIPLILSSEKISKEMGLIAMATEYIKYVVFRKGQFTTVGIQDLVGFINTTDRQSTVPNIQYMHSMMNKGLHSFGKGVFEAVGIDDHSLEWLVEINKKSDIVFMGVILLRPKSSGYIKLRSANPQDPPMIITNYYKEEEDLKTLVEGIRFAERLEKTETFIKNEIKINKYDRECADYEYRSDEYWKCYIKYLGTTVYHPIGTAKMGPDSDPKAVVDSDLKVKGIKGLRIADASIIPNNIRANPNGAIMMVGEVAADKIIKQWLT